MFEAGRLITIKDWLADLKTLLPGHTAYAVSRSLHDWQRWVAAAPDTADWAAARSAVRVQGRLWRELLTGEKAARDILSLSDYLAAARRGTMELIWRFWWVIAAAAILTGGVIYAGLSLHSLPDLVRVVGSIAWLAGAAGLPREGVHRRARPGSHPCGGLAVADRAGRLGSAGRHLPAPRRAEVPGGRGLDGTAGP